MSFEKKIAKKDTGDLIDELKILTRDFMGAYLGNNGAAQVELLSNMMAVVTKLQTVTNQRLTVVDSDSGSESSSDEELMGGELEGGKCIGGGGPKDHKKVMRKNGTFYWRRTSAAIKRGVKHHKSSRRK